MCQSSLVFPNPSNDRLTFELEAWHHNLILEIFAFNGKQKTTQFSKMKGSR